MKLAAGSKFMTTSGAQMSLHHGGLWVPGLVQVGACREAAEPRTCPMSLNLNPFDKFLILSTSCSCVKWETFKEVFSALNEIVYVKHIVLNAQ